MKITSFHILKPYQIEVIFNDGKTVLADFEEFLKKSTNPLISQFLDIDKFYDVKLDDYGTLVWGDDEMDINPLKIYEEHYSISKSIQKEFA
jgi:Protein of unknown function (DUF2442)